MNEFRASLCFGCRHRGEAEGRSRCFHPLSSAEQVARLSDQPGPLGIKVVGPYAADFSGAFPNGFHELAIDHCNGQTKLQAGNAA